MTTYNVYRNDKKVASGITEKTFTDTGLTPNTEYTYQVSAENAGESGLSVPITVTTDYSAPMSVSVSPKTNNLTVGATRNLTAVIQPDTAKQSVSWVSSDEEVATVDSGGTVTAVSAGTATITATSTDDSDIKDTATVNVTEPEEGD